MHHQLKHQQAQLEKEQLQRSIDYKNRELATHLLAMQKKNESLLRITEDLKKVQLDVEGQGEHSIKNIVKNLTKSSEEQIWPEFEKRFKDIHGDFYKNLSTRHPDLTPNELKLCAFMKMNMSSKEISAITSQSTDTIKMARYRLRAKLNLQRSDSLVSYLNQL
jgi:DNA-binding CsgD family transcriptional regulator